MYSLTLFQVLDVSDCLQGRFLYMFDNQIIKMHKEEEQIYKKYVFFGGFQCI